MSQCPHCFVGQCQRHKLQDHGKREQLLKAKMIDPKAAQRRLYDSIVTKQLDKLEAAARAASAAGQVRAVYSNHPAMLRLSDRKCSRALCE